MRYLLILLVLWLMSNSMFLRKENISGQTHPPEITSVAWSPNGNYLAAGSTEGIRIYDAQLNEIAYIDEFFTSGLEWSPDSNKLAFFYAIYDEQIQSDRKLLTIWNRTNLTYSIPPFEVFQSGPLAWSPDGTELAIGAFPAQSSSGGAISVNKDYIMPILNIATGQIARNFDTELFNDVSSISWSFDGQYIAAANGEDFIIIWDASTGEIVKTISTAPRTSHIAWSPNSTQILLASKEELVIWEMTTEQSLQILEVGMTVDSLSWQDDRIAANPNDEDSQFIKVWRASDGQLLNEIIATDVVFSIGLSPDGARLAYGDGSILQVVPAVATACNATQAVATSAELISAITSANANPDASVIGLAAGTYNFTSAYIPLNVLPAITSEITIIGNGATLTRQAGSALFGLQENIIRTRLINP